MSLGSKIKVARNKKGFTLKELGEIIGITHSALSQIENDKTDPSKKTLIALANALNDNFGESWLDEYLNGHETPQSKKEIVKDMTVKEFVSLKFGGKPTRRSKAELEMLTKLLEAEIERLQNDE